MCVEPNSKYSLIQKRLDLLSQSKKVRNRLQMPPIPSHHRLQAQSYASCIVFQVESWMGKKKKKKKKKTRIQYNLISASPSRKQLFSFLTIL